MQIGPTNTARRVPTHAVLPAAGRGVRFGSPQNKVLAPLAGRPLVAWTLEAFAGRVDTLTLVVQEAERGEFEKAIATIPGLSCRFAAGGATRQESVASGLAALSDAGEDDVVLVHDAARPLVSSEVIERCIEGACLRGCAVASLPVADTLKEAAGDGSIARTIDREGLWAVQTPQAFRMGLLRRAHREAASAGLCATDEASLVERLGVPVHLVEGARENIKVTTPADSEFAARWLDGVAVQQRVGTGYDIHRLVPGRPLWLGGVCVPSALGLAGHSDADVVLHALCDALLGAAGLPDIGQLFPNDDPAYAGASSLGLLADVAARLLRGHWRVGNVDCTVIAEEPKIAPHVQEMRVGIAQVLGVSEEAVSIKATTNEGLGALGERQGIACHAIATIVR